MNQLWRRNIKRAEKEGVEVTVSDLASRRFEPALALAALAQLALAFAWPLSTVNYSQWFHLVL